MQQVIFVQYFNDSSFSILLQVKDALGMWTDVHLESDEVAVIWGQTATQASAGLFRPATYRVVTSSSFLTKLATTPVGKEILPVAASSISWACRFHVS